MLTMPPRIEISTYTHTQTHILLFPICPSVYNFLWSDSIEVNKSVYEIEVEYAV